MAKKNKKKKLMEYELRFILVNKPNEERKANITTDLLEEELEEIINYNVDIVGAKEIK